MHLKVLRTHPAKCLAWCRTGSLFRLVHLLCKFQSVVFANCPHLNCLLCCSVVTISEFVGKSDIPEERKDNVKKILHDLGYAASREVGSAFLKITEKHMTDAGIKFADANAILAELEPVQGDLL